MSWILGHLPSPPGVDLHIVCPVVGLHYKTGQTCFMTRGATWHCVEKKHFEPLFLYRRLLRSIRCVVDKVRPDIIHGWGGETGNGLLATYLCRRAVVSVQGLLRLLPEDEFKSRRRLDGVKRRLGERFRRWLEEVAYRRAGICLCESETARHELKRLYGIEGVIVPQPLRGEFLGEEKVKGKGEHRKFKFLFVGQAVARKGYYDVQEAFKKVKVIGGREQWTCSLTQISGGKSAAEIAEFMRTHDVFVLPSYGDTGPTAIKEALAMGMPVIAYDNTGPKELLEKYGGTLVKTGDVEALAVAMAAAVQVKERGEGEEKIRHDLSKGVVWEKLLKVYEGSSASPRIAVLMTCHNRKEKTLRCLDSLLAAANQVKGKGQDQERTVDVFIVDDGSTDGTSEAVQKWFRANSPSFSLQPSTFNLSLIRGSGSDYWAKGMARAWQAALDYEKECFLCSPSPCPFTFFLWLNDDTILYPSALSTLLRLSTAHPNAVLNGTLVNAAGTPVYGLNVRNTGLAGNCVLVPRPVFEKVGMICGRYAHAWADRDYGLQVEKAGFRIVSAGVVGTTEWHPHRPSLAGVGFRGRCQMLVDPKGWNVHDLWLLRYRNWNVFYAIASCVHMAIHVMLDERE